MKFGTYESFIGNEIVHVFIEDTLTYLRKNTRGELFSDYSKQEYNKRRQCMIDQYNEQKHSVSRFNVDGDQTLAKNLADNGGIKIAYRAYKLFGERYQVLNGKISSLEKYTNDQLFFISFAQFFCEKSSISFSYNQIAVDKHTPNEVRVKRTVIQDVGVLRESIHHVDYDLAFKLLNETIDDSVDPCNNFYKFACGKWIKNEVIKPEYTKSDRSERRYVSYFKHFYDNIVFSETPSTYKSIKKIKEILLICSRAVVKRNPDVSLEDAKKVCIQRHHNFASLAFQAMTFETAFKNKDELHNHFLSVKEMFYLIRDQFDKLIDSKYWLDEYTKRRVKEKLNRINFDVEYHFNDYSIQIMEDIYSQFTFDSDIKYGELKKKMGDFLIDIWREYNGKYMLMFDPIEPATLYDVLANTIYVNYGTLQEPTYNITFPTVMKFGALGSIIGHEIVHGFSGYGLDYLYKDVNGSLLSDNSLKNFNMRKRCLIEQYSMDKYPSIDMPFDGAITIEENIADNGGVKIAYHAYKNFAKRANISFEKIPGLEKYTNDQLFFISFAQTHCEKYSEDYIPPDMDKRTHAPGEVRVIETLANQLDFTKAFQCAEPTRMNPGRGCEFYGILNDDFKNLDIVDVELTGLSKDSLDTVIFTGHISISSELQRNDINQKINKNSPITIFKLFLTEKYHSMSKGRITDNKDSYIFPDRFMKFGKCKNGGVLLPNNKCQCKKYYQGSNCEQVVCLNSGIPNNDRCICPPGFISSHCEPSPPIPSTEYTFDVKEKSFIYVINLRDSMSEDVQYLIENTKATILNGNVTFTNFILTIFISNSEINYNFMKTNTYLSINEFIFALESITFTYGDIEQPILSGIWNTLSTEISIKGRSNIFVYADSISTLSLGFNSSQVSTTTLEYNITMAYGFLVYYRIAQASFGEVFYFEYDKFNVIHFCSDVMIYLMPSDIVGCGHEISEPRFTLTFDSFDDYFDIMIMGDGIIVGGSMTFKLGKCSIWRIYSFDFGSIEFQCSGTINYYIYATMIESIFIGFSTVSELSYETSDVYSLNIINEIELTAVMYAGLDIESCSMTLEPTKQSDKKHHHDFGVCHRRQNTKCSYNYSFDNSINTCKAGSNTLTIKCKYLSIQKSYTRTFKALCIEPLIPTLIPLKCNNGGVLNAIGNGCLCTSNFTGNTCDIPVCYNGGSINPYPSGDVDLCLCIDGFNGGHCEKSNCNNQQSPDFDISHRTFSIVMGNVSSQAYLAPQIANGIEQFMNITSKLNPDYITEFTLTTYSNITDIVTGNSVVSVNSTLYTSSDMFVQKIRKNKFPFTGTNTQNSLEGLLSSLNIPEVTNKKKRAIFWFVDQNPVQYIDNTMYENVLLTAISSQTPINVIYTQSYTSTSNSTTSICQNGGNGLNGQLTQLAYSTGGIILDLCFNNTLTDIENLFTTFANLNYRMENIYQAQLPSCDSGVKTKAFFSSDKKKYILVNSNLLNSTQLQITDINGIPQNVFTSISTIPNLFLYDVSSLNKNTIYNFNIDTSSKEACSITIMEESIIVPFIAFTKSAGINFNDTLPQFGSTYNPVIHLSSAFQSIPSVELTNVLINDVDSYDNKGILRSSSCSYDYFFESKYSCNVISSTFYLVATIQVNISSTEIFNAQRYILSYCQGSSSSLNNCINGGVSINGTCVCPYNYIGDYCEKPLCYNGGTSSQNQCQCAPNFFGDFCQYIGCDALDVNTMTDVSTFAFNTVIFVVENTCDSIEMNKNLVDNIDSFINSLSNSYGGKEFALITVDSGSYTNVIFTPDTNKFINIFKTILSTPSSSIGQDIETLSAIQSALQYSIYKPTIIYVFTTNGAVDKTQVSATASQIGDANVQINYIYVPLENSNSPSISTSTKYMYTQLLAYGSGGRSMALNYGDDLISFIQYYLPLTIEENSVIEDKYINDGSKIPTQIYFPIENQTEYFTITVSGKNINATGSFSIYTALGNKMPDQQYEQLVWSSGVIIVKVSRVSFINGFSGKWKIVAITSSDSLRIQVRVKSSINIKVGFSSTQTNDFVSRLPGLLTTGSTQNYITSHIPYNMFMNSQVLLQSARIYSVVMDSETTTDITMFTFLQRNPDTCSFQYVSPQVTLPKMTIPTNLMIQINDVNGFCQCSDPNFIGHDCNTIVCQNGGTSDGPICNCPPGYFGSLCEKPITQQSTSLPPITGSTQSQQSSGGTQSTPQSTGQTFNPNKPTLCSSFNIKQYYSLFLLDNSLTGSLKLQEQINIVEEFFNYNFISSGGSSVTIQSQGQDSNNNAYQIVPSKDVTSFNWQIQNTIKQIHALGNINYQQLIQNDDAFLDLSTVKNNKKGIIIFINSFLDNINNTKISLNQFINNNNESKVLLVIFDSIYQSLSSQLVEDNSNVYLFNEKEGTSDVVTWILQQLCL
uniref:Peptidase_M13 domain-containing protein n=1 Tax=Parastrongyloides trichosuri TaxID=131310 RepID=A0A0N4ZQF0_PARTI